MTKITKLTKTSNLVLLTILIGVSVTSAYAITITLGADPVNIFGDLNVVGTADNDDDSICFDDLSTPKCIFWDNTLSKFSFDTLADFGGGGTMNIEGSISANAITVSSANIPIIDGGLTVQEGTLTAVNALDMDGILLDTSDDAGTSGQVLSSTGIGTDWITASGTGTVTSVGTGTGLTGGPITTSGPISIDTAVVPQLGAVQNTFTGGMLIQDDLNLSGTFTGDNDSIFFDDDTEFLMWEEPAGRFVFTGDLEIGSKADGNDDQLLFDGGTSFLQWSEGNTQFEFSRILDVNGGLNVREGTFTAFDAVLSSNLAVGGFLNVGTPSTLTISNDEATPTRTYHTISPESANIDDLVNMTGTSIGDVLIINPTSGNTIDILDTGNIVTGTPLLSMTDVDHTTFIWNGTAWKMLSTSVPSGGP